MLRNLKILILFAFSLVLASFAEAIKPEKVGLHLSFEERVALTYALMAQGESEETKSQIVTRAKKYFEDFYRLKVKTVNVRNFNEFLKLHKGEWPDTHSVALDLEMIETKGHREAMVFEAGSPRVQRQIDSYLEWRRKQLTSLITQDEAHQKFSLHSLVKPLTGNTSGRQSLEKWMLDQFETVISDKMKELDRIGEKIAESNLARQQDATTRILLQTIFSEYFSRLSLSSKKLLISSYLGGNLQLSDMQKFEVMVQNSGPHLQKLLQVVARQANLGSEMLEVFRALENSVRPVPWGQVKQILDQEKDGFKFVYFERKPLGVGTMAQVHRAKIQINGDVQDVVVRFIKPGIEDRVEEDRRILNEVAMILDANPEFRKTGAPKMQPIVQDIAKTVAVELHQNETMDRQKMAATPYNKTAFMNLPGYKNEIQFHVPKIYEGKPESKLMVQEMVIGGKLDKAVALYKDLAPDMKKVLIEKLVYIWIQEVMFGGGFYHSDFHQGNFMVLVTEKKIIVSLLDYGMGGVISSDLQEKIMLLGAGTELLDPEIMARAFWAISDKSNSSLNEIQLRKLLAAKIHNIQRGLEQHLTMERWTAWVMDQGVRLPYEFVSLNRGIVILNKLLEDAGSKLTVTQMMKSMAKRNPWAVYNALVIKNKLSYRDFVKLGWSELKKTVGVKSTEVLPPAVILRCEGVFQ